MTTPLSQVGYTSTIDCFGDSLTAGAGGNGQNLPTCLSAYLPTRMVNNWGIGGQTAEQIAARQGGRPVTLSITGGALTANFASAAVVPSTQLLSTPSDNITRYLSGVINGVPATISRIATGGPPSTSETYSIMGAGNANAVTVPSWAPFVPDQGWNARDSIQVLWLGRNNVGVNVSAVPGIVADCVNVVHDPKRVIVIGVLVALGETPGSANGSSIAAVNATLAATYGAAYVPSTPPTVAEMTAVGYTPTTQDNTEIASGVWPTGLHAPSDTTHLNGQGYQIFALRVKAALEAKGW